MLVFFVALEISKVARRRSGVTLHASVACRMERLRLPDRVDVRMSPKVSVARITKQAVHDECYVLRYGT